MITITALRGLVVAGATIMLLSGATVAAADAGLPGGRCEQRPTVCENLPEINPGLVKGACDKLPSGRPTPAFCNLTPRPGTGGGPGPVTGPGPDRPVPGVTVIEPTGGVDEMPVGGVAAGGGPLLKAQR